MTMQELLRQGADILKQNHIEDPSREAGLLLSRASGMDLSLLYAHLDRTPDARQIEAYFSAIERRANHEPYAYITGQCEFFSLTFEVNPHVLIPRADTELLAEAAIFALGAGGLHQSLNRNLNQNMFRLPDKKEYRVLDVGTGSGCLAVSVARYAPSSVVDAVDLSGDALDTARRNARRHHVRDRINFIRADFLKSDLPPLQPRLSDTPDSIAPEPFAPEPRQARRYDLIISNPPYIPSGDIPSLMADVRDYEPHTALDGGRDGLAFYRAFAEKARDMLDPDGVLAVECGFDQALAIRELFEGRGMRTLILKDLSGFGRVVAARQV